MKRGVAMPGALLALGIAVSTAGALHGSPVPAPDGGPSPRAAIAIAKARAGHLPSSWGPAQLTPGQARLLAERTRKRLPLPPGGNFNGVRWELAELIPAAHLGPVLEHNARCQWWRALHESRDEEVAREVVEAMTDWPHLRGAPPMTPEALNECYASHRREVRYARSLGLEPSR